MNRSSGPARFAVDVGAVLFVWGILLALENLVIGIRFRDEFTGSWEMAHARAYVSPLALGASLPLAIAFVAVGRVPRLAASFSGAFGGAVAFGVSTGRHFESVPLRVIFVLVVAAVAAFGGHVIAPRAGRMSARALAGVAALVVALSWLADAHVLPRLYPAFHFGLFAIELAAAAIASRVVPGRRVLGVVGLAGAVVSLFFAPRSARAVVGDDNLRRVLLEHAPLLGRAVWVGARLAPPAPLDDAASDTLVTSSGAPSHALDWRGKDVVLVTIDALRADHVGAYGYARNTTPNIDRLAARGVRFEHAYCPTPHTSYSISSMMTGTYMRPLLAMGAKDRPETWATQLRRYGYRTAAFYPPAVFFIDEHRFKDLEESGLGFEYRKVEFATPALKREQIQRYLEKAPRDKPLFLWVHLFEPHEPYEMHPQHPFAGDDKADAYDSEIAEADAVVGDVEAMVERWRKGAVFIVTADHGEELGDHGGRYHGTTVYEEQVRVPLVIAGAGGSPRVVSAPVQTIDLLPTTLAALDVPLPARVRGRDLGARLASGAGDEGLAFAETDDWTLVARGTDRLVCARKIGSCTLFDVSSDPGEKRPVADRAPRVLELRKLTAAIERENGKHEASGLPDALRRGLQGDRDAAEEVAALLDDARTDIRRKAARVAFDLREPAIASQLKRAASRDEDPEVRGWAALAVARLDRAAQVPDDGPLERQTAGALVLAERGDARGDGLLVARWEKAFGPNATEPGELDEARALLAALAAIKSKAAVPALARSLDDVRLRPYVVDALGEIGDPRAKAPLLAAFADERYLNVRPKESAALLKLGARDELRGPLTRFAGMPDPMVGVLRDARAAKLLEATSWESGAPSSVRLTSPGGPVRLFLMAKTEPSPRVDGELVRGTRLDDDTWVFELGPRGAGSLGLEAPGVLAAWVVSRTPEIPPPPPRAWDAGPDPDGP